MGLKRIVSAIAGAALLPIGLAAPTADAAPVYDPAAPPVTVYNTPGGHLTGGRLWSTSCEEYSSTVVRCHTDIWSTKVEYSGGRYFNNTGWHFNNLTYLPSNRASWSTNPLAKTGQFTSESRQWRTECDTDATGRGGCRSYIETKYIVVRDGRYSMATGFVFNNQVQFAHGAIRPVTEVPRTVLEQARLTPTGLGPIQFGSKVTDLELLGYLDGYTNPQWPAGCKVYNASEALMSNGIDTYAWNGQPTLNHYLEVTNPDVLTDKGAHVGMKISDAVGLYDGALLPKGRSGFFTTGNVGGYELQFETADGKPNSPITRITAQPYTSGTQRLPVTGC